MGGKAGARVRRPVVGGKNSNGRPRLSKQRRRVLGIINPERILPEPFDKLRINSVPRFLRNAVEGPGWVWEESVGDVQGKNGAPEAGDRQRFSVFVCRKIMKQKKSMGVWKYERAEE